jgi:hypothetical protein
MQVGHTERGVEASKRCSASVARAPQQERVCSNAAVLGGCSSARCWLSTHRQNSGLASVPVRAVVVHCRARITAGATHRHPVAIQIGYKYRCVKMPQQKPHSTKFCTQCRQHYAGRQAGEVHVERNTKAIRLSVVQSHTNSGGHVGHGTTLQSCDRLQVEAASSASSWDTLAARIGQLAGSLEVVGGRLFQVSGTPGIEPGTLALVRASCH